MCVVMTYKSCTDEQCAYSQKYDVVLGIHNYLKLDLFQKIIWVTILMVKQLMAPFGVGTMNCACLGQTCGSATPHDGLRVDCSSVALSGLSSVA